MIRTVPREERRGRSSLRSRIAGAGLALVLAASSVLIVAPAASAVEQPFAVGSPQSGSSVNSTTPTFSGTGTTGNTVTLTYSGQQLLTYTAGTAVVDDAGNWSTPTSFASANPGETETRVRVTETTPTGTETGTFFITVNFPSAPVPAAVFTLESPTEGETRNDLLNIVNYLGTGNAGNTVTVRYFDGRGGLAVAGTGTVNPDGRFNVLATFTELPAGQDFANTFTLQTTPAGDRVSNEIGRNINFAVAPVELAPFTVTSPQNGETVDTTTPAFTGTGIAGDTVTLTYGGQRLGTYVAGTATIGANGQWTVPATDFSSGNFGETDFRVSAVATSPAGVERPGARFVNITLPEAPAELAEFTLTSPVEGETRDDFLNIVHFVGTGEPGNTVYVEYFNGRGGLSRAGDPTSVRQDGTFDVFATFRDLPAGQTFANTFTQQTDAAGNSVAQAIGRNINFAVAPVEATPFIVASPANGENVDSLTPEFRGTGTPGDTVTLTYGGQGLGTYVAGTAVVDVNGDWVVPTTDFSDANFGETEIRVSAEPTQPSGAPRPGGQFVNIVLPEAPAEQIDFTLTTPEEGDVIENPRTGVSYVGTGEPGNTVTVQYFNGRGGLSDAGSATVNDDGSFEVVAFFDDLPVDQLFANTFTQQYDADGNSVAREIGRTIFFELAPVVAPLDAPTLNTPVVDGTTVTFTGTGLAGATLEVSVTDAAVATTDAQFAALLVAPATLTTTVGADGTWTVSDTFEPGDYSATATQFTGDGADRSAPTAVQSFTVAAIVVPVDPGTTDPGAGLPPTSGTPAGTSTGATTPGGLAATGADSTGSIALAMLLVGAGAVALVARRRTALTKH
jgi:hypothetical protein